MDLSVIFLCILIFFFSVPGESTDALQTSGLSTFMACRNTLMLIWFSSWALIMWN